MTEAWEPAGHGWRVWRAAAAAGDAAGWQAAVEEARHTQPPVHRSKHATTYRWEGAEGVVYVKVYHRYRPLTTVKDLVRPSKARHVVRASARLADAGFAVPAVLAAGERRRGPVVREAWIATAAVAGVPVAERLAVLARAGALGEKRGLLRAVGTVAGRLHAAGVVAGDLVPANVWAATASDGVVLLDHDRTRLGRGPAPWARARRNLVQLNRVVLEGITVTDRLRTYRAYAEARGWSWRAARGRLRWVVARTIDRRRRFDRVLLPAGTAAPSFRELMRAKGPWAGKGR